MRKTSGVYQFMNTETGKPYTGSSDNCEKREGQHLKALRKGTHHSITFQRAFNKFGEAAFIFSIVEIVDQQENEPKIDFGVRLTTIHEQSWLDKYQAQEFIRKENKNFRKITYNISPTAGSTLGVIRRRGFIKGMVKKLKQTLIDHPEIMVESVKKRKQTYANNPEIKKEATRKTLETKKANPPTFYNYTPLLCYDLQGELVFKAKSIREASKILKLSGSGIHQHLIGNTAKYKGFMLKKFDGNIILHIPPYKRSLKPRTEQHKKRNAEANMIPIFQYDLKGNFLKEYLSLTAAAKSISSCITAVSDVAQGKQGVCKGFKFYYTKQEQLKTVNN